MLYAVNLTKTEIWLVESETLEIQKMKYKDFQNFYTESKNMVYGLVVIGKLLGGHILNMEDREVLSRFKNFCSISAYSGKVTNELTYEDCVPLALLHAEMSGVDYNTTLADVVVRQDSSVSIDVWYKGKAYLGLARYIGLDDFATITGIYREGGKVMLSCFHHAPDVAKKKSVDKFIADELGILRMYREVQECSREDFIRQHDFKVGAS